MRKENNYYYIFVIICFVICFVTSFALTTRSIHIGSIVSTASVLIFPMTYFLSTLYTERYGKEKLFNLLVFAVFSLIFCSVLIGLTSLLPISGNNNSDLMGLGFTFQGVFAFIVGFFVSQIVNIKVYYYLEKNKSLNFLVSSVIAVTIHSILFVVLANFNMVSFKTLVDLTVGEYVLNIFSTVIYSLCFAYIIKAVVTSNKKSEMLENMVLEHEEDVSSTKTKKTTSSRKVTSTKKATSSKKTTTSRKPKKVTKKEA